MIVPPMPTFINPSASDWLTIASLTHRGQAATAPGYARVLADRLRNKHDVPGVEVIVEDGVVTVCHPAPLPGMEDGWEMLGEHP